MCSRHCVLFAQWLQTPDGVAICFKLHFLEGMTEIVLALGCMVVFAFTAARVTSPKIHILVGFLGVITSFGRACLALNPENSKSPLKHLLIACGLWMAAALFFLISRMGTADPETFVFCWLLIANATLGALSTVSFWKSLFSSPQLAPSPAVAPELFGQPDELTLHIRTICSNSVETTNLAECAVCLNSFCLGDIVRELHCNHTFHSACIEVWLINGGKGCPLCRADASTAKASKNDSIMSEAETTPDQVEES